MVKLGTMTPGKREMFVPTYPGDLALFLRDRRVAEDCHQWDVAETIGTSQSAVSEWESCVSEPLLSNAMIWANVLGYRIALMPFEISETEEP